MIWFKPEKKEIIKRINRSLNELYVLEDFLDYPINDQYGHELPKCIDFLQTVLNDLNEVRKYEK